MNDLIILGAGGLAKQVYWILQKSKTYNIIGFLDETISNDEYLYDKLVSNKIIKSKNPYLICAVGGDRNHFVKERWVKQYSPFFKFATIIDLNAQIADDVKIGEGTIIQSLVICGTGTSIGKHVRIGHRSTLPHDIKIGNFCSISSGVNLGGVVTLKNGVDLGVNCILLPKITIAKNCIIGAGAVVTKNTEENKTYIGIPAKILKK